MLENKKVIEKKKESGIIPEFFLNTQNNFRGILIHNSPAESLEQKFSCSEQSVCGTGI